MSKDFLIKHICPHRTKREWIAISGDYQTIRPAQPPSSGNIELRWNRYHVPKQGLQGPVEFSTELEPFDLEKNVSDELRVSVNEQPLQVISLPIGVDLKASLIADRIDEQITGLQVTSNNGRIHFKSFGSGRSTSVFLKNGSAHESLGLPDYRLFHGTQSVPGWGIVKPDDPINNAQRLIRFDEPLRTRDDLFEISYFTRRQDCRRCNGLGIEDDIRFNDRGRPIFTDGVDLLLQEAQKITFTIRGTNIFYDFYGTSLVDLIGTGITAGGRALETQLAGEISQALQSYRDIKLQQEQLQPVTDQEFPLQINRIDVQQDPFNPTVFNVEIEIQNRAQEVDQITQNITVDDAPFAAGQDGFLRVQ